jgi:glycosyltransferase involved in cell wall biosynthesis
MRVLHVMEATIGGTRRHLGDVARGQLARGLEVHLAVSALRQPDFEADLASLERAGARVLRLDMVRSLSPRLDFAHWRDLARHLETVRPDVVHTHSSKAGALGRAASIATGIGARVHTPHTFAFLFDAMFGRATRALYLHIERALGAETQVMIAVSDSEAATFAAAGVVDRTRVRVVENGIDPAPWLAARPLERSALAGDPSAPLAVVVGLLNVAKGQDLAIDLLGEPGLERLHLAVVGHGEEREALESRARALGVSERVRFLGFRTDVPAILAATDFVLVPSRWEGMPYIVLEAQAAARPVVATPVDGSRDLVAPRESGASGFLSRDVSVPALADACRALLALDRDARASLGRAGREALVRDHSAERMVDELIAVYREAL